MTRAWPVLLLAVACGPIAAERSERRARLAELCGGVQTSVDDLEARMVLDELRVLSWRALKLREDAWLARAGAPVVEHMRRRRSEGRLASAVVPPPAQPW